MLSVKWNCGILLQYLLKVWHLDCRQNIAFLQYCLSPKNWAIIVHHNEKLNRKCWFWTVLSDQCAVEIVGNNTWNQLWVSKPKRLKNPGLLGTNNQTVLSSYNFCAIWQFVLSWMISDVSLIFLFQCSLFV